MIDDPFSETNLRRAWESAESLLRAKGVDVDAMLERAGEAIRYRAEHPWDPRVEGWPTDEELRDEV